MNHNISPKLGVAGFLAVIASATVSLAADQLATLENARLKLSVSLKTGGVTEISNKLSGETYHIDDPGFLIEVGKGKEAGTLGRINPSDATVERVWTEPSEARVHFVKGAVKITVSYRLDADDSFAVKRVRVNYTGEGPFNVSRLDMFDWDLNPNPAKAIPYYGYLSQQFEAPVEGKKEQIPSNSTAFFMRYAEGGMFTAVSCDFVYMRQDEKSNRCRSVYWPGLILYPDESFESELGLIGVYRREGYFHKPYATTAELGHGFLRANVDVRLDRGEIDAIRTAVQKFLKPGRYTFVANGWAMGLPSQITNAAAVQQYKKAIDVALKFPNIEGIHFIDNLGGLSREFGKHGLDTPYKLNPYIREAFDYAREEKMGLSGFVWTSRGQPAPEDETLLTLNAKGERNRGGIALTKAYADFIRQTFAKHEREYPHFMGVSFDFMYFYPDYDADHGYLPGVGSLHAQWSNMRNLLRNLRTEFPDWMLRPQIGWRQHSPWLAENSSFVHNSSDPNIAVHRNFLDFHASLQYANNLRLTSWFAANCKMFPRYMMNSFLVHKNTDYKAWDYGAWEYCVLSRIAAGCGFGMLNGKPDLEGGEIFPDEQRRFLMKWMDWQRARRNYYLRATTLFGEPRPTGVDGMAYGNGKDSFVFLCNPTFESHQIALPIGKGIHLEEGSYTVKELYPEERYRIGLNNGAFDYGSQFVMDVPAQTIAVIEVKPVDPAGLLLLGIAGNASLRDGTLAIRNVSGPPGWTRQFAVRLPRADQAVNEATIDGQTVSLRREGQLLHGRIRFGGEPVIREIFDWKVMTKNGRTSLTAEFFVPDVGREILARQALPVSIDYRDNQDVLKTTGWVDWSRFIIHLPVLPEGAVPDKEPFRWESNSLELEGEPAAFRPAAFLNRKMVDVNANLMRRAAGANGTKRWSGFFIDADQSIRYGSTNTLTLEFPGQRRLGYFAAYLPNLTLRPTSAWKMLAPLRNLKIESRPGAAEAYPPIPTIQETSEGLRLHLRISLSGSGTAGFSADKIKVENGSLDEVILLDPRQHAAGPGTTSVRLSEGNQMACARFRVDGARNTQVRLLNGTEALATFTLGQVLDAWRSRGDRFDPFAMTLHGNVKADAITIELVGPAERKIAVIDSL